MASTKKGAPPRFRAAKACERCRARKVRCDIVHKSKTCTNCFLDRVECVEVHSRRRKDDKSMPLENLITLPTQAYATPAEESHALTSAPILEMNALSTVSGTGNSPQTSQVATSQTYMTTTGRSDAPLPDSNEDLFPDFTTSLLQNGGDGDASRPGVERGSREVIPEASERGGSRNWQRFLPAFIVPVTSQRTYRYHDFLNAKGAFALPPRRLRDTILARYAEFVHPHLPVVDLHSVLQALATDGREGKVSLLLFQAIMLAGACFVDLEYVYEAGFQSRMALRQELAERVRLLYDFDSENDRLILVQALILMTSWQEKGDEVKHLRHWISVAHNIALLLGLNRDMSSLPMSIQRRRLCKRVWWSLYMRDRTLALGLRQTPLIASTDCKLPDLDPSDFDVQPASAEVCSLLGDCALLQDLDQQQRLAEVCVAQLELSHHLAEILEARYTTFAPKMGCTKLIALVLVPKAQTGDADGLRTCSLKLDQWYRGLRDPLKYRTRLSLSFDPGQHILLLHCGLLNLYYYALVCALHRPYPSPVLRPLAASDMCFQRKSRHAADAILAILGELQVHDLVCYLPTQGITFMLQAAITLLGNADSMTAYLQSQSHKNLESCLEMLNSLKDVHSYAFWATNFLTTAVGQLYRHGRAANKRDEGPAEPNCRISAIPVPASLDRAARLPDPVENLNPSLNHNDDLATLADDGAPLMAFDYPPWIDPYVNYDTFNPLDLFFDADWPGRL